MTIAPVVRGASHVVPVICVQNLDIAIDTDGEPVER